MGPGGREELTPNLWLSRTPLPPGYANWLLSEAEAAEGP